MMTLGELRLASKQRANLENSSFVTDSEWLTYINFSISELKDILISKFGEDYYLTKYNFTLLPNTSEYDLPLDFYKLSVMLYKSGNLQYKMKRFIIEELNSYNGYILNSTIPEVRYRLSGDKVEFTPQVNNGGQQVTLCYIPIPPKLVSDSDELQGFNGWEELVVLLSARKALVKEEQSVSELDADILLMKRRIEAMADNRDASEPMRIADTERIFDGFSIWP